MKRKSNGHVAAGTESEEVGFDLDEFLPYQLVVTANRVSRLFARRYADEFGLSLSEWRVLMVVAREEGVSPSTVSGRARMDKVKVSRATSALVSRGLLKQSNDPNDGRARMLRLTKRGQSLLRGVVPVAHEIEAELSRSMSANAWSALHDALTKLDGHVPDVDGPPVD